jgi:hypothetical protein
VALSSIKQPTGKEEGITDIYKKYHPVTPKEVVNVFDLGHPSVEKDFPEQLSALLHRKKRNLETSAEEIDYNKSHSIKRGGGRTCNLPVKKIQNTCRCF